MKTQFTLLGAGLSLLLLTTDCHRDTAPVQPVNCSAQAAKNILGTWSAQASAAWGNRNKGTMTFNADSTYTDSNGLLLDASTADAQTKRTYVVTGDTLLSVNLVSKTVSASTDYEITASDCHRMVLDFGGLGTVTLTR